MLDPAVQEGTTKSREMPHAPFFTVFTPTFNRARTLHRVFDSLCSQILRDFEWVVVDDGSTDNTPELIKQWAEEATFPIRYFRQPNSGKHIAHNFAVREARGVLFAVLDSDDALETDALERIRNNWLEIPVAERARYSGLGSLCRDQQGKIIGVPFPTSPFDADFRESFFVRRRFGGEKWGVSRTDVLRQFPFPDIKGTNFVPEALTGFQMAKAYKRRYVNEVFRIYYVANENGGATLTGCDNIAKGARGRLYFYAWILNNEMEFFPRAPMPFIGAAVMLPVVARYGDVTIGEVWRQLKGWRAKALLLAASPLALALGVHYALKFPLRNNAKKIAR
jgi:glycosyltransferase involved in cell wall biosynthesis